MKLSTATSIYVNFPLEEAIPRIASAGFDCVDIWGGRPHVYRHDYDKDGLVFLRDLVESYGLFVSSFLPAFFRYPHSLSSPNNIIRKDSLDYVQECIENASILGAKYILICPARLLYGQTTEEGWKLLSDSIDKICSYAAQFSLNVMLEAVNTAVFDLLNNTADVMRMIKELNTHANLGAVLDTGHLHLSDETIHQALNNLSKHLFLVHINDNDGKHQQNLIPGDGTFDFHTFLSALHQHGYQGIISAELSTEYAANPDKPLQETVQRLHSWIKTIETK